MQNHDIKKQHRALYAPKPGVFALVEVPTISYLMVDGHGDPNTSDDYADAVVALFSLSYGIRALAKRNLERVHTVAPLEGLWSADEMEAFTTRRKSDWDWTMMIAQPEWIDEDVVAEATRTVRRKKNPAALEQVRFAQHPGHLAAQVLHVGSYDDEGPVIAELHDTFIANEGCTLAGHHHEIYLSDVRKTVPEKLRTIIRQPVERL
ncbi:GyrI-like domain-containing protein [Paramicrobacterium chengjingii]|uniref:GyrI-like domain-containing protein n=1 Tax=Paramicrobacterium chengjingii TaxID=2769067 RepID=UPI00142140FD|nr:GyrI-like domain-containing protein [Microbacterium chengjingii]